MSGLNTGMSDPKPDFYVSNYENTTLILAAPKVGPGAKFVVHETNHQDIVALVDKYLLMLPVLKSDPEQIEEQLARFKNATFSHIHVTMIPVSMNNVLWTIMYFANGILLNINALPQPPLAFNQDTVNGFPLADFLIPIREDSKEVT